MSGDNSEGKKEGEERLTEEESEVKEKRNPTTSVSWLHRQNVHKTGDHVILMCHHANST